MRDFTLIDSEEERKSGILMLYSQSNSVITNYGVWIDKVNVINL